MGAETAELIPSLPVRTRRALDWGPSKRKGGQCSWGVREPLDALPESSAPLWLACWYSRACELLSCWWSRAGAMSIWSPKCSRKPKRCATGTCALRRCVKSRLGNRRCSHSQRFHFLLTKKFRLVRVVCGRGRVQDCVQRQQAESSPVCFGSVPGSVRAAIQKW